MFIIEDIKRKAKLKFYVALKNLRLKGVRCGCWLDVIQLKLLLFTELLAFWKWILIFVVAFE